MRVGFLQKCTQYSHTAKGKRILKHGLIDKVILLNEHDCK